MMSGFNVEEFRRGVPAMSRKGDVWKFVDYYENEPVWKIRAESAIGQFLFRKDGRYDLTRESTPHDLIAMIYNDMDEKRTDNIGPNGNEGLHYDAVNHPKHYTSSPAICSKCSTSIECIQVTEHMGFNLGNATKYIWRADLKGDAIEDLKKAAWYINREIEKRERVK